MNKTQEELDMEEALEMEEALPVLTSLPEESRAAVVLAVCYGSIDGEHHKRWVIDQMVRALAGEQYDTLVAQACDGEDGPHTYDWDTGIAP